MKQKQYVVGRMVNFKLEPYGKFHLLRLDAGKQITLCSAGSCGSSRIEALSGAKWEEVEDEAKCKVCVRAKAAAAARKSEN